MDSPVASPMLQNGAKAYLTERVGVEFLAAEAEEEAKAAAAAEEVMADTIEDTLGALLRAMDSTGGKSSTRKEAEEDSGKRSEMQSLAKALTEEFTSTSFAPERRKKPMKQHEAMSRYAFHIERARAARAAYKAELAFLSSMKRKDMKKNTKNQKTEEAVVNMNSEGSDLYIQEESENELGRRLEMKEIRPQRQLYAEGDYYRKAILGALLDIKEKLVKKKTDEDTLLVLLLLLKGMSNRLDQGGYDENNEIDKGKSAIEACLYTNGGTHTTMVESDVKPAADPSASNSMTIQAETLQLMVKDFSNSINEGVNTTMVESDIKPAADTSATDSKVIQAETMRQMITDLCNSMNVTMVESDVKPAADPSAINSITIQDETVPQMVKYFSDLMRSTPAAIQERTPMVGSDKLLIQPADPSSTDSMTRLGPYSLQDDLGHDKVAEETSDEETSDEEMTADKQMAYEARNFADYRRSWEAIWSKTCGSFEHMTALSSMQFTCYALAHRPLNVSTPETLRIFSIKLAEISGGLKWPLSVYGMVAARDVVDHNRNFLFYCDRNNSQELRQNDPFLRLIGPSRAVIYKDKVNIEIQLRVKDTTMSQDAALITEGRTCRKILRNGASTICIENCFCKIELCVQMVRRTTQATILGVQVVDPTQWPFKYGGRVACFSLPGKIHVTENKEVTFVTSPASGELVMVDSKDGAKLKVGDGYLHLSRNVVSVEDQGRLDVEIQAYSESGDIAAQALVKFPAKYCKITREECFIGGVKVVITVAWSLVADDKRVVMSTGALVQACVS